MSKYTNEDTYNVPSMGARAPSEKEWMESEMENKDERLEQAILEHIAIRQGDVVPRRLAAEIAALPPLAGTPLSEAELRSAALAVFDQLDPSVCETFELHNAMSRLGDALLASRRPATEREGASRMHWFLTILKGMGGSSGTDDNSWLDTFCDDGDPDTFNRAVQLGYTRVSHDDRFDLSTVHLTDAGRRALLLKSGEREGTIRECVEYLRRIGQEAAADELEDGITWEIENT